MVALTGKRILVAGSATGIGAATARRLADDGARLVLGDIDLAGATAVAEEIIKRAGTAHARRFDLTDAESIEALIADTVDALGGLDGVANIAADTSPAVMADDKALLELDIPTWNRVLNANLTGTALICKAAIPHLIAAGGGAIVNTSSGAAAAGEAVRLAYGVSKAGTNALTRHIATAYGAQGVRANAIAPGLVASETVEAGLSEDFKGRIRGASPIKRLGEPEDIAGAFSYLLSDDTQWITGQVWHVNGGIGFRD